MFVGCKFSVDHLLLRPQFETETYNWEVPGLPRKTPEGNFEFGVPEEDAGRKW